MAPPTKAGETRERIYRFVRDRLAAGHPPTVREVQQEFGFQAFQTAHGHLERLVAEGRLAKRTGLARGYFLPSSENTEPPPVLIPILGRVQAGALSLATEDLEGHLPVQARMVAGSNLFALRVRGDSMINAGIFDQDIVVVRSQPTAESGEIVVALVGDEATVKRLKIRRRRIELHPENPAFDPIIPPADQCTILGKVIELHRFLEGVRN